MLRLAGSHLARLAGLAGGFVICATSAVAGVQDLEMAALVSGRKLPPGYYQRIGQRPDFYSARNGWVERSRTAARQGTAVSGNLPILVLLARFADSPTSPVTAAEIQRVLFDGPHADGTLTAFYDEQSGGALRIAGNALPWIQGSLTAAQVRAGSFGLGEDARTGEFFAEIAAADASVDYGLFDNDGPDNVPNSGDDDGIVDALAIEFLEAPLTCNGEGPTIWAHRSSLTNWNGAAYQSNDMDPGGNPIIVDDYMTQAAVNCNGRPQTTVVISHEFGHILGLPDLYDQAEGILAIQRNWVVGCWSIMAAGQWGCGRALAEGRWNTPPHMGPWEKGQLGWLPNLRTAGGVLDQDYVLQPVESTGDVLRIDLSADEHLLVEYRDGSSFDRNLPATGVLVHHIDQTRTSGSRRCRTCPRLYQVALLEADANNSLTTPEGEGGSRGEAGDIFVTSGITRLTNTTVPSTRLNSGAASDVSIYNISVSGGEAHIRVSTRTIAPDRLAHTFLNNNAVPLTPEERTYLDELGNANGRYDVGDLQIYLAEHPSVVARIHAAGN